MMVHTPLTVIESRKVMTSTESPPAAEEETEEGREEGTWMVSWQETHRSVGLLNYRNMASTRDCRVMLESGASLSNEQSSVK